MAQNFKIYQILTLDLIAQACTYNWLGLSLEGLALQAWLVRLHVVSCPPPSSDHDHFH